MSPIIHCIRHGQGLHNLAGGSYHLRDPDLTPLGMQQCSDVRNNPLLDRSRISLVFASPLRRTLHSAVLIFSNSSPDATTAITSSTTETRVCLSQDILALPDLQETSDDACDIGSDPVQLRAFVAGKGWPVNLSHVKEGWNTKNASTRYSPQSTAINARAKAMRLFLQQQVRALVEGNNESPEIAIVTHGSFLHFFTDDWEDADRDGGTGWQNCEVRSYIFEHDPMTDEDDSARLKETGESRRRRGKLNPMPELSEQPSLFEAAMRHWGNAGLQRPDRMPIS